MKSGLKYWLAGAVGGGTLDALFSTVRFRVMTLEHHQNRKVIFTVWHGRLLPATYQHRHQDITTLISQSADGEYISRVVDRWGYKSARGSSSRGGREGLLELIDAAVAGNSIAITPDGPRGPLQKLKRGVITAAQMSGLPILPMSTAATKGWWFESWDRFLVPRPFSTVFVRYGDLVEVPHDASEEQQQELREQVEAVLNTLTEQVDEDAQR